MVSSTFVAILLIGVVFYVSVHYSADRLSFPIDTIERVLHSILKRMDSVTSLNSPRLALIQIRDCQSSLQTLIQLVGDESSLDVLCGIDVERIQNILYFQEVQMMDLMSRGQEAQNEST
jgi:hypothetical protein